MQELHDEIARADADDLRSLGLLAVDLTAAALLVSVRQVVDRFWYWALVGLGVSVALLLAALWRRSYETGPDPRDFYVNHAAETVDPERVALFAMIGLSSSTYHNNMVRRHKGHLYSASLAVLILTVLGGTAFLLGVH